MFILKNSVSLRHCINIFEYLLLHAKDRVNKNRNIANYVDVKIITR